MQLIRQIVTEVISVALELFTLAESEGIAIEWWDFNPPLEAVYWAMPELPPVIGLSYVVSSNQAHLREVLAEELGHHFTSVGHALPHTFFHYRDRLLVSKSEYHAIRWAANYLIPQHKLQKAMECGITTRWELAEHFNVTEQMMNFRLRLPAAASYHDRKGALI